MHTGLHCRWFLVVAATFLAAQTQAQPRFTFDTTPGQLAKDVVPAFMAPTMIKSGRRKASGLMTIPPIRSDRGR